MFFVGIFGIGEKEVVICRLQDCYCKKCHNDTRTKVIKRYKYFHIFFLPIIKWNSKYYLLCEDCNSLYELDEQKGKRIEKDPSEEITYWDLKALLEVGQPKNCSHCGQDLEKDYIYCPYCGSKI